jgi:hypothetical protein
VADRWRGIDPLSHRSVYFQRQLFRDVVTRVEVRWFVACSSLDDARALQTRAAAVSVADFRGALVECSRTDTSRGRLGIADAVAHLWKVAEVVHAAAPQLFALAPFGVASTVWTLYLDLDEAKARPRVLAAAVAAALGVADADVTISVHDAAHHGHAAALALVPRISDELRNIPATGDSDAAAAVSAMLDAHFAAPPSSDEDEDEDGDDDAPARLLEGQRVFMSGERRTGVRGRNAETVTDLGGDVVGTAGNPTLAIFPNNGAGACTSAALTRLRPSYRIVRERWLARLAGATELPDFRPDAVFAEVNDILDPRSYFYDALAPPRKHREKWRLIREDWTPPAQADDDA